MSNELKVTIGWSYDKNSRVRFLNPTLVNIDVDADGIIENVQSITTVAALVEIAAISSIGWGYFRNAGENEITLGFDDSGFVPVLAIPSGDRCVIPKWSADTLYAKTATGSSLLDYVIIEQTSGS